MGCRIAINRGSVHVQKNKELDWSRVSHEYRAEIPLFRTRLDPCEDSLTAAKRELREETG